MKEHILIVEDEAILYERLRKHLVREHYTVDEYTPSVEEAIARINIKRPDLVLLDIDLKGEATGLDLGKMLNETYQIHFIYVTDFDDDQTFYQGLQTNHEHFVVKTKPNLDVKQLIRTIQTVLNKFTVPRASIIKDAILVYVDYIQNTKDLGNTDISQTPVLFKDIAYITTNSEIIDEEKSKLKNKTVYKKLERNNSRLCTWDGKSFIIPDNLAPIYKILPHYFVRISEDYIVNINDEMLDGRINGKRLKIRDQVFTISETYKQEVEKRIELLYQRIK